MLNNLSPENSKHNEITCTLVKVNYMNKLNKSAFGNNNV